MMLVLFILGSAVVTWDNQSSRFGQVPAGTLPPQAVALPLVQWWSPALRVVHGGCKVPLWTSFHLIVGSKKRWLVYTRGFYYAPQVMITTIASGFTCYCPRKQTYPLNNGWKITFL